MADGADITMQEPVMAGVGFGVSLLLHVLGWILFGLISLRARVLPRWAVVLAMAGPVFWLLGEMGFSLELTQREREVLDLIASGESNQAIAGRLHISPRTVGNHISNIFNKLQVSDRAQGNCQGARSGAWQRVYLG